jgi:lipopolysaccharide export system protein LptA
MAFIMQNRADALRTTWRNISAISLFLRRKIMKRFIFYSLWVLLAITQAAQAEKADSEKPSVVDSNHMTYDDVQQVNTFTGNVVMTRGTLIMHAEKVVVTTDPDGYQFATLYAGPGKLATFRQKRDGGPDLWIEGEADRIEYDGKTEIAKLFSHAKMQRLTGTKVTDEVRGEFISYDSRAEYYTVNNTPNGDSKTGSGRITAVIQPRVPAPASAPTGAVNTRSTTVLPAAPDKTPSTTTTIPTTPAAPAMPTPQTSPAAPAKE